MVWFKKNQHDIFLKYRDENILYRSGFPNLNYQTRNLDHGLYKI
jgi:hypothetical protein